MATITTRVDMIKPWSIGVKPAFFMSLKLVFKPIAASAPTIKNLLRSLTVFEILAGTIPKLLIIASATNPKINQGKTDLILYFKKE